MVYPRLSRISQRVVPTSLGCQKAICQRNKRTDWTFCAQARILRWGLEDSRVVGLFPFHWNGYGNLMALYRGRRIIDLPRCSATQAISELILNAGEAGTTRDPQMRHPKPDKTTGAFPEPVCTGIIPPPDIWASANVQIKSPRVCTILFPIFPSYRVLCKYWFF